MRFRCPECGPMNSAPNLSSRICSAQVTPDADYVPRRVAAYLTSLTCHHSPCSSSRQARDRGPWDLRAAGEEREDKTHRWRRCTTSLNASSLPPHIARVTRSQSSPHPRWSMRAVRHLLMCAPFSKRASSGARCTTRLPWSPRVPTAGWCSASPPEWRLASPQGRRPSACGSSRSGVHGANSFARSAIFALSLATLATLAIPAPPPHNARRRDAVRRRLAHASFVCRVSYPGGP